MQLAMLLAAAGLGINDSTGAIETLPPGHQPDKRERCDPCHSHRHPQVGRVQCYGDDRKTIDQLNRLLRPSVAGYPNCEVVDPYKPIDNVIGQLVAEWRAVLAAQLRFYNQEAPAADPAPSADGHADGDVDGDSGRPDRSGRRHREHPKHAGRAGRVVGQHRDGADRSGRAAGRVGRPHPGARRRAVERRRLIRRRRSRRPPSTVAVGGGGPISLSPPERHMRITLLFAYMFGALVAPFAALAEPATRAEVAALRADLNANTAVQKRVLYALEVQQSEIRKFWQKRPIFEADLSKAFTTAREQREAADTGLAKRIADLEVYTTYTKGAVAVFLALLMWFGRSRVPIIRVKTPPAPTEGEA